MALERWVAKRTGQVTGVRWGVSETRAGQSGAGRVARLDRIRRQTKLRTVPIAGRVARLRLRRNVRDERCAWSFQGRTVSVAAAPACRGSPRRTPNTHE